MKAIQKVTKIQELLARHTRICIFAQRKDGTFYLFDSIVISGNGIFLASNTSYESEKEGVEIIYEIEGNIDDVISVHCLDKKIVLE